MLANCVLLNFSSSSRIGVASLKKPFSVLIGDRLRVREFDGAWIAMHTVQPILVVQVIGRRQACRPDVADGLALPYTGPYACLGRETRHVGVQRGDVAAMLQDDGLAIARLGCRGR